MSYILDALKRADAERARGAVPGLHAQPWPNATAATPTATSNRLWLLLAAAVALVALVSGLWFWRTPAAAPQVAAAAPPLVTAPTAMPAPAPTPVPDPVRAPAPVQVPVPAVLPAPARPVPAAMPPAVKALPAAPQATPASTAISVAQPDTVAAPADKPSASPAANTPSPAQVPLLSELPETLRSQVPALTITGTVYSETPALRLLLVNNQVLPQGSTVAAGVTLEDIRPRSSVFSFRGTRFRLAH